MRNLSLALAATVLLGSANAANATDLFEVVTPVPTMADEEHDWTGFYAGIYTNYRVWDGPSGHWEFGKLVGYNVETSNDIVLGVEGRFGHIVCPDVCNWQDWAVLGRVGIDINEGLLLFANAGIGQQTYFFVPGPTDLYRLIVGGGIEYAVSDNLSVRGFAEYNRYANPGPPPWVDIGAAAIWHFN